MAEPLSRMRLTIRGAVQGVGFRPFIYRLATELGLTGWVNNSALGVAVEIEGSNGATGKFLTRLKKEKPPHSSISSVESLALDPAGYSRFEITASRQTGEKSAVILPDIATCKECLREIFDPHNRRYLYPFTNCTHCGPRFSIVEALPYDRCNTSMKAFAMCESCREEYHDPRSRRFHAQPNACAICGPQAEFWDARGQTIAVRHDAILAAAQALRDGKIIAVKGIGGFNIMADARNERAVRTLRELKHREHKPFAVMFPSLKSVKAHCEASEQEAALLESSEAPIVLIRRKPGVLAPAVAPGNPAFGALLPYSPLHHLLLSELGFPVIATSGNLSGEPICIDEHEALHRLAGLASHFLVHNRPIVRPVDDSVIHVIAGREQLLRRARGYAPLPFTLESGNSKLHGTTLAVGAHFKNTITLAAGQQAFVSQHIGDLDAEPTVAAFQSAITSFERLYGTKSTLVIADAHPDYFSTRFARQLGAPLITVQHHFAHVLSCMADNHLARPLLGVAWDGTGYGSDGTIWGGEFLRISDSSFERVAHLRTFRLPGGDAAALQPCRSALGLLYEMLGDAAFAMPEWAPVSAFLPRELAILKAMFRNGLNVPKTSSIGRLFDAVASITGLRQRATFEGQAAMDLQFACDGVKITQTYTLEINGGVIDWEPMIREIAADLRAGVPVDEIAAKFQNALVEIIVSVAHQAGEPRLVLTGGCFQNRYLTERAVLRLKEEGFHPFWHRRIPPNDGGISLGQIIASTFIDPAAPAMNVA